MKSLKTSIQGITKSVTAFAILALCWTSVSQGQPEYYNGTSGTSYNAFPLNSTTSNQVQWIYAPTVFNSNGSSGNPAPPGYITHVYFRLGTTVNASNSYTNYTISLGQNQGTSSTWTSGNFVTGLTQCFFQSSFVMTGAQATQWYGIELQNPFQYNPNLSLVFELKVSGGTGNQVAQTTTGGSQRIWGLYGNTTGSFGTGLVDFGIDVANLAVPNNAGITALPSLQDGFCADTLPVTANIRNFGNNILDSVQVSWSVNNVSQGTDWYILGLDTMGSGDNDSVVTLGEYVFVTGNNYDVKAWTTMPNNEPDTVNDNDTIEMTVGPALIGTYVIGTGSGADYPSFTAAVADLNLKGVCGDVIFDVQSGTYTEQISINNYVGASEDATVTFRSQAGSASAVTLQWGAANAAAPHTVKFNGADWVTFEDLTILNTATSNAICFDYASNSNYNTINECVATCSGTTTSSTYVVRMTSAITTGNTFKNNTFAGGYYAVYCYSGSTTTFGYDLTFENNTISTGYIYGLYLYSYRNSRVIGNTINALSTSIYLYGVYMLYSDNSTIERNYIYSTSQSGTIYALYFSNCYGTLTQPMSVANNCILSGYPSATGTTSYYGIYLTGSGLMNIYNNTVTKYSGTASYPVCYITGSAIVRLKNNSFTSYVGSPALFVNNSIGVVESSNNNFFTSSGALVSFSGTTYTTLEAYSAATNFDTNSVNVDPSFTAPYECKTCSEALDGGGTASAGVLYAIDSADRSTTTPDIGATEFVLGSSFSLGPDTTYCGSSHTLESGPAQSVLWLVNNGPSTGQSVTLTNSAQAPANYTVIVNINTLYCGSGTDTAVIRLVPNASLTDSAHICADEVLNLTPGGGSQATYNWSTGENTPSISVNAPGTYSVVKSEEGCESEASTVVTQSTAVEIDDVEGCLEDGPVSVDATIPDGFSYAWSGGSSINTAVNTFDQTGIYTVTVTDAFACVSTDEFNVNIIEAPQVAISHQPFANYVQFSSAGSLFTTANSTYNWSFGDGNTSTDPNPGHAYQWIGTPTTYNVTLEITNICGLDDASLALVVDPLGVPHVTEGNMNVFPNPAKDQVLVTFGAKPTSAHIQVLDITGRVVVEVRGIDSANTLVDVSQLASGSYILKAITDSNAFTSTLVVE